MITVYIDEILIASLDEKAINVLEKELSADYEVKDLGQARYCLRVEFKKSDCEVSLGQHGYIQELFQRFDKSNCKPVVIIVNPKTKNKNPSEEELTLPYRKLVGVLTDLSATTSPDIAYSINRLEQFKNCYGTEHWKAAKHVLHYLIGTVDIEVVYKKKPEPIKGFADLDWEGCIEDGKSQSGYMFLLSGEPISWDSKKQGIVALSTTEVEYIAMADSVEEAIHLQRLIQELGYGSYGEFSIYCDNRYYLAFAENQTFHARSKHTEIRHHFISDVLSKNLFSVKHISSEDQMADYLTKGFSRNKH